MLSPTTSVDSSSPARPPPEVAAAPEAQASSRWQRAAYWGDRFAPPLAFIALIVIWEAACRAFHIPSFLLPAPSAIVVAGFDIPIAVWLGHIGATLRVALMGYAAAIVISIPLAVALVSSRLLSRTLYPILVIVQSTPIVAIAPIIIVT